MILRKEAFWQEPLILRKLLIHNLIGEQAGSNRDITAGHIQDVLHLFDMQVGKSISLPYGLRAERTYDGVRLTNRTKGVSDKICVLLKDSNQFCCRIFDNNIDIGKIPKKKYTKWLDYDKIEDNLCVRNRCSGDFFLLEETGKRKKLKQYFVDEKIPQEQRDEILLIADGTHIVWVVGYRISAKYKVTENTRRILEIQYDGGRKENE
jgi:tRNA(Ile)-lysidine synthase